jgi:hypothetical protein
MIKKIYFIIFGLIWSFNSKLQKQNKYLLSIKFFIKKFAFMNII